MPILEKDVRSTGEMSTWSICQALNNGGTYKSDAYTIIAEGNKYSAKWTNLEEPVTGTYFVKKWGVMYYGMQGLQMSEPPGTFEEATEEFILIREFSHGATACHIQEVWV